ncbi:uracil-DNA glycosylase family protein [Segetibacter koreensis]|uniref:uracil-DNA glycosylase family protein n=1 Tax=Segetibacter koreensis TaxID=398037 RepID=UPI00036815FA|nr:uracil-DNA glycosylase family protein [Segetibacter koreensis]
MNQFPSFCSNPTWNAKLADLVQEKIFKFDDPQGASNLYEVLSAFYSKVRTSKEVSLKYPISFSLIPSFRYVERTAPTIEYVGIDVPVYYNYREDTPKIMVVGIDPLRSEPDLQKFISLGTPYAFHLTQHNIYWQLMSGLMEQLNLTVYLTDTFKLYFKFQGKRSYDIAAFTNPEAYGNGAIHQEIFAREVELVKPDLIVTLGKHPRLWFTSIKEPKVSYKRLLEISNNTSDTAHLNLFYNNIPVLPLMHLSPLVRHNTRIINYGVSSNEDIIEKYVEFIKVKLKN